jgi:hypothetical protein
VISHPISSVISRQWCIRIVEGDSGYSNTAWTYNWVPLHDLVYYSNDGNFGLDSEAMQCYDWAQDKAGVLGELKMWGLEVDYDKC